MAESFELGEHLSMFCGNLVACAAAPATIDGLENSLVENALGQGECISQRLSNQESEFDVVRKRGRLELIRGVELVQPNSGTGPVGASSALASKLESMMGKSLKHDEAIIDVMGYHKNVMRFQPPLSIEREQLKQAVGSLCAALEGLSDHRSRSNAINNSIAERLTSAAGIDKRAGAAAFLSGPCIQTDPS